MYLPTPSAHTSGQKDFLNQRQVSFSYQIDLVFIVHLCECIHVIVPPIFDLNSHYKTMQETVTLSKNFKGKKKKKQSSLSAAEEWMGKVGCHNMPQSLKGLQRAQATGSRCLQGRQQCCHGRAVFFHFLAGCRVGWPDFEEASRLFYHQMWLVASNRWLAD